MKRHNQESDNIRKVLKYFSRSTSKPQPDAPVTYVVGNTIYTVDHNGEQRKVKDVEENIAITKRFYKVRAN